MPTQIRYLVPAWIIAFSIGLAITINGNSTPGLADQAQPAGSTAPASTCPADDRSNAPDLRVAMILDRARRAA